MSINLCETPHLAIIHLLRAMGTCSDQEQSPKPIPSFLLEQKHQAQMELNLVQNKIMNSPCAIKLQEEILDLEHLVGGLRHQNKFRKEEGWMELEKISNAYSTQNSDFLQQQSNKAGEEMAFYRAEQRRLEEEYQLLILKVKKLHQWNEGIVNSFGKQRWERM